MTRSQRRTGGFTLVEILIAMLIGLVAVIVIMQTYAVSEGFKRTSSSGSDAQTNGGVALYLLERELRMAGYGFNSITNCATVRVYNASTGATTSVPVWPPVQVNPAGIAAGDANTDVILVAYGNADDFTQPQPAAAGSTANEYAVTQNYNAFRSGDLLVAYNTGGTCILNEVTAANYAAGTCSGAAKSSAYNTIGYGTGNYRSTAQLCNNVAPQHNPAGGVTDSSGAVVGPLVSGSGWVFNLGPSPQVKAFAIMNGALASCDLLSQNCTNAANFTVVMNDVVSLRAVFGIGDQYGIIQQWSRNPAGAIAVALEVAARSPLKEKPQGAGGCDATVNQAMPDRAQNWFGPSLTPNDGSLAASQINLSALPDWQCYRYKLFQTTVPVRNAIWTPTIQNPPGS